MASFEAEPPGPPKNFARLNDYELLHQLDNCDVLSLIRFGRTCKRHYLLTNDVMARSSSLVSATVHSVDDVRKLVEQLQSPPNLLIAFSSNKKAFDKQGKSRALQKLSVELPTSLAFLYADHYSIQQGAQFQDAGETETEALGVLIGSFPEAQTASCLLSNAQVQAALGDSSSAEKIDELLVTAGIDPCVDYRVFIVNVCPRASNPHSFIAALTKRYPRASILGGISGTALTVTSFQGVFTSTLADAKMGRESCVSMIAIAGNCPLSCVVTRGVEPVSPVYSLHDVIDLSEESILLVPKFESTEERGNMLTVNNVVHGLNHAMQTRFNDGLTAGLLLGTRISSTPANAEPFWLVPLTDHNVQTGGMAIEVYKEFNQPTPNELRIFRLSNKACQADVPRAMNLAKVRFAELDFKVMGCLLFSCTGRGPRADFFDSDAFDARTFISVFPEAPLLGTYVNGEVGPNAMADATSNTIFREGHASLQGFTAVFGIFAVPKIKKISSLNELLSGNSVSAQDFVSDLLRSRREA